MTWEALRRDGAIAAGGDRMGRSHIDPVHHHPLDLLMPGVALDVVTFKPNQVCCRLAKAAPVLTAGRNWPSGRDGN